MKERPILFSTPMVQAILDGRKTITRRIINPQPAPCDHSSFIEASWRNEPTTWQCFDDSNEWYCARCGNGVDYEGNGMKCRQGKAGDILWVRETWRKFCYVDEYGYTHFDDERIEYAADNPEPIYELDADGAQVFNKDGSEKMIPWKPSIHMPKVACRLKLKIVSIRVERLHDITEEEAIREGIEPMPAIWGTPQWRDYVNGGSTGWPCNSFVSLWTSINGDDSWKDNPWVWRIEFTVLPQPPQI